VLRSAPLVDQELTAPSLVQPQLRCVCLALKEHGAANVQPTLPQCAKLAKQGAGATHTVCPRSVVAPSAHQGHSPQRLVRLMQQHARDAPKVRGALMLEHPAVRIACSALLALTMSMMDLPVRMPALSVLQEVGAGKQVHSPERTAQSVRQEHTSQRMDRPTRHNASGVSQASTTQMEAWQRA